MKVVIGANLVVANSKELGRKNPKAIKDALATSVGKQKVLLVTFTDANGTAVELSVPLRAFKGGSVGGYYSNVQATGRIVEIDAPVGKDDKAAEKSDAKLAALTEELLGE